MQLPLTTFIAEERTVADWNSIRTLLIDSDDSEHWKLVFDDYFFARLKSRYLNPIESIKQHSRCKGEGFSIMTIICSLIEFLETTYRGKNYRYVRKGDKPLRDFEYSSSSEIFRSFLTSHKPSSIETIVYRDDFYDALIQYIHNYQNDLLSYTERKSAFLRKFDRLCEE